MGFAEYIESDYFIERCKREEWNIFKGTHFHDCYELYYLEDGEITYFVNDDIYNLKEGDFILIPPGTVHKALYYRKQAHTRILIYIKPDFLKDALKEHDDLLDCIPDYTVTVGRRSISERILKGLLQEEEESERSTVMIKAMVTELFVWLSRWAKQESCMPSGKMQNESSGFESGVVEIVKYINTNFDRDISLADLSERFYMNPTYLSRMFKKVMGVPYSKYLISVRIRQAVKLLNDTNKKIAEIALLCGFHSDNHFCKMFKQVMGITPLKYRNGKEMGGK